MYHRPISSPISLGPIHSLPTGNIDKKFAAHYDAIEQQLKSETVGLVTLDEMKAKQEDAVKVSCFDTII